jgi:hypothetical protein
VSAAPGQPELVLRDVHVPPAPPWWPPAPGWWALAAVALLLLALAGWWLARRQLRRRRLRRLFDDTLAAAATPAERLAAMSALLRRAARLRDPRAPALEGAAWLQYLDAGADVPLFAGDQGAMLLEGAFHRTVDPAAVEALRPRVRRRFLEWMGAE